MKERDFQTQFKKHNKINGVFELKLAKGKSMPFSAVPEHQIKALCDVSLGDGLYHKISDSPIFSGSKTRFTKPKPFDCFFLRNIDAYLVVMFYVPRRKKMVYYIKIIEYIDMVDMADRKSMTEEMAKERAAMIDSTYLKNQRFKEKANGK